MSHLINNVIVVGGGTAGWLSAAILAKKLSCGELGGVQVTVIESPNIPILGVGEGTWPNLRGTLKALGIDEGQFMKECDATFKQGAEFVDWAETPIEGKKNSYYHPLNTVFNPSYEFNLAPYWLLGHAGKDIPYDQAVASQSRVCDLGLAPKKITTAAYDSLQEYSYHLNAVKFAKFLKEHCLKHLNVKHHYANLSEVNTDEDGFITSVISDEKQVFDADFFVDCSGSRALLLEGTYKIPWKSISDTILNDSAMALQVPYEDKNTPIVPHTVVTAKEAGWVWDIGLQDRRGVGYVYGSKYTSDERAEALLREHIGPAAEGLEVRKFPLNLGYREKFWHKNCVAIGMSAAFVEPLEASAIYLFDAAANMIADQFPRSRKTMPSLEKRFNKSFTMRLVSTVDFIKLHYCISKRRDTAYWVDNCDNSTIPKTLQTKLEHWKYHAPSKYDFEYSMDPFLLDSHLFILYGMRFDTDLSESKASYKDIATAEHMFKHVDVMVDALKAELPKQRELVEKVYEYGFSKI